MNEHLLLEKSANYMKKLCEEIGERCVGSKGNRDAADYFEGILASFGFEIERQEFEAMDWENGGAKLSCDNADFEVLVSPYSLGFLGSGILASASTIDELEKGDFTSKILLLHGELAKEQLMPKNFVFYNPDEHQKIIALLEKSGVLAIICATGRNSATAGGVYPFPLIEDGDFDISSVYMTEEEGEKLLPCVGKTVDLKSVSKRIPSNGYNVIGRMGKADGQRIVVTAHIDAKKGTPGAIDNATGVATLLILAELLRDYKGERQIEIVAFNGEDYYAVPGQMLYLAENQDCMGNILLNINIDGAGYKTGKSTFSLFDSPDEIKKLAQSVISRYDDIIEGTPWYQGDHSIFLQNGVNAIAVSSQFLIENMEDHDITHTPKDNLSIVNFEKIVTIAKALDELIRGL